MPPCPSNSSLAGGLSVPGRPGESGSQSTISGITFLSGAYSFHVGTLGSVISNTCEQWEAFYLCG